MNLRNLFWQTPFLLLLLSPLWWQPVADFLDPAQAAKISSQADPERSFVMSSVTLVQIRDGREEFLLNADTVQSRDNRKTLQLANPRAVLKGSREKIRVSGHEAIYETGKEILTIIKDVVLNTDKGATMTTSVMRYLGRFGKVKSAAPLDFKNQDMHLTGTSFFYDLNSGNFRVGKRVKCSIY